MRCPKCDTFEVPGGVSACVECALADAIRQRDEARALVAVEARRADAWKAEADKRGEALEEVREAARATLKGMCETFDPFYESDVFGHEILGCSICGERIATGAFAGIPSCDECAKERGGSVGMTRRFAPALRRLRAMLEVSP